MALTIWLLCCSRGQRACRPCVCQNRGASRQGSGRLLRLQDQASSRVGWSLAVRGMDCHGEPLPSLETGGIAPVWPGNLGSPATLRRHTGSLPRRAGTGPHKKIDTWRRGGVLWPSGAGGGGVSPSYGNGASEDCEPNTVPAALHGVRERRSVRGRSGAAGRDMGPPRALPVFAVPTRRLWHRLYPVRATRPASAASPAVLCRHSGGRGGQPRPPRPPRLHAPTPQSPGPAHPPSAGGLPRADATACPAASHARRLAGRLTGG